MTRSFWTRHQSWFDRIPVNRWRMEFFPPRHLEKKKKKKKKEKKKPRWRCIVDENDDIYLYRHCWEETVIVHNRHVSSFSLSFSLFLSSSSSFTSFFFFETFISKRESSCLGKWNSAESFSGPIELTSEGGDGASADEWVFLFLSFFFWLSYRRRRDERRRHRRREHIITLLIRIYYPSTLNRLPLTMKLGIGDTWFQSSIQMRGSNKSSIDRCGANWRSGSSCWHIGRMIISQSGAVNQHRRRPSSQSDWMWQLNQMTIRFHM